MSTTIITYVETEFACIVFLQLFLQHYFLKKSYIVIS